MKTTLSITFALALLAGALVRAADAPAPATAKPAASAEVKAPPAVIKVKPYLLDTCIVSGDKLGGMGTPIVIIQDGQEVKFCCSDCPKDFAKDPAKYLKLIADAEKKLPASKTLVKEAALKPYPLDVCLISGRKIGSMGAPVVIQYNGQEIKLCCPECLASFNKDPLAVLQKVTEAQKKAAPAK
jgi:YHS domain-containing protein